VGEKGKNYLLNKGLSGDSWEGGTLDEKGEKRWVACNGGTWEEGLIRLGVNDRLTRGR